MSTFLTKAKAHVVPMLSYFGLEAQNLSLASLSRPGGSLRVIFFSSGLSLKGLARLRAMSTLLFQLHTPVNILVQRVSFGSVFGRHF